MKYSAYEVKYLIRSTIMSLKELVTGHQMCIRDRLLVLIGYVTCVGNTSMEVEIDTYVERSDGMRYSVNRAFFVMVAMDENEHPMQVPGLKICTEAEKGRHEAGLLRKNMRKNRMKTGF